MNGRRVLAIVIATILVACGGSAPTPEPDGADVTGQPIVIGLPHPPFAQSPFFAMSNAVGFRVPNRSEIITQLVYNGLYRYDDSLAPVPDLAAEPCEVQPDQVTIICRIVEATFHNGTPLTADDVAFTFELGRRRPDCLFAYGDCFDQMLTSATAVDERTVEFRLTEPNASFLTLVLPGVLIDSREVVEEAYAPLAERAPGLDAADYQQAADTIFAELFESDAPDCEPPLADAEALLQAAGIEPLPRDQFLIVEGQFDACIYAEWTAVLLEDLAASLGTTGLDAIALAYRALSFNRSPVGTGPWRFISIEGGTRVTLEGFASYHRGPPATPSIEVRVIRDPTALRDGLLSGELDWVPLPAPDLYAAVEGESNLQFVAFPDATYFMLAYNLRDGMLFAEHDLRAAVELCIDKPATVEAATDGTGDVLYSPVEPVSWAFQADLPRPERDVAEARRLIESGGWAEGDDGIYQRDGVRLATDVYVRADDAQRVAFMDLVAEQVLDCGIEFTVIPADLETVLGPLQEYPHVPGGYEQPFEAIFLGWGHGFDPHDLLFHSSSVTSPEQPVAPNFMGFSNPEVDALLDEGIATYDQRERARIYREFQQVLAEERPVLFGWALRIHEALDARLGLTEGEPNLSSRQWFWELEKLVLRDGEAE